MALNLGISYDSHDDDQGKKPPQFTDGMFLLQPLSDPRTLTQCVGFHEMLAVEDGLVNYVLQHTVVLKVLREGTAITAEVSHNCSRTNCSHTNHVRPRKHTATHFLLGQ